MADDQCLGQNLPMFDESPYLWEILQQGWKPLGADGCNPLNTIMAPAWTGHGAQMVQCPKGSEVRTVINRYIRVINWVIYSICPQSSFICWFVYARHISLQPIPLLQWLRQVEGSNDDLCMPILFGGHVGRDLVSMSLQSPCASKLLRFLAGSWHESC